MDPPPVLLVMLLISMSDEWVENVNVTCVEKFLATLFDDQGDTPLMFVEKAEPNERDVARPSMLLASGLGCPPSFSVPPLTPTIQYHTT